MWAEHGVSHSEIGVSAGATITKNPIIGTIGVRAYFDLEKGKEGWSKSSIIKPVVSVAYAELAL